MSVCQPRSVKCSPMPCSSMRLSTWGLQFAIAGQDEVSLRVFLQDPRRNINEIDWRFLRLQAGDHADHQLVGGNAPLSTASGAAGLVA